MLKISNSPPDDTVLQQLAAWQAIVDTQSGYSAQVAKAKREFTQRNKPENPTFSAVRSHLYALSPGAEKCVYCEQDFGEQVEHVFPKSFYPEKAFDFRNFIGACPICNREKNNNFARHLATDDSLHVLKRRPKGPVTQPPDGTPVMLSPLDDNIVDFLDVDFFDTFFLLPRHSLSTRQQERVQYTIDVTKLNAKNRPKSRAAAFGCFRGCLAEYEQLKLNGAPRSTLGERLVGLLNQPCASILYLMRRDRNRIGDPDLIRVFDGHEELNNLFWFERLPPRT